MTETRDFLLKYYDGVADELVVNLRITGEGSTGDFFSLDELRNDPERAEKFIADHESTKRVCFVPPLCKPGTTKQSKPSGCASLAELHPIEFLFVDDDAPKNDAPPDWKESELARLNGVECYALTDTGNGLHVHYRLDTPVSNDKARTMKRDLVATLGGDVAAGAITQPARIPGTQTKSGDTAKCVRIDPLHRLKVSTRGGDAFLESLPLSRAGRDLMMNGAEGQESESRRSVLNELTLANVDDDDLHEFLERDDLMTTPKQARGKIDNERWRQQEIDRARENVGGWLSEMNAQMFVTVQNGTTVIASPSVNDVQFSPVRGLRAFYANKLVHGRTNQFDAWLTHPLRAEFERVVCDPSRSPGANGLVFNTWRGMIEPRDGDVSVFQEFVRDVICDGDADLYDYAVKFFARLVQHPAERGGVAFVMKGGKGTGKGTLATILGSLFRGHYCHIFNQVHLTGRFNDHLRDVVLLFGDEVFYAGDKRHEGVLKGMITEPGLVIEQKNMPVIDVPNMLTILLAANAEWAVPASDDERRFCVANVSDKRVGNRAYFETVRKVSRPAILAWLLAVDLKGFDWFDVPQTIGLDEQKDQSMNAFDKWLVDYLEAGRPPMPEHCEDFHTQPLQLLCDHYMRTHGGKRFTSDAPSTFKQFCLHLKKACPDGFPNRERGRLVWFDHGKEQHGNGYRFPDLETWREFVESDYLKRKMHWPEIVEDETPTANLADLKSSAFDQQRRVKKLHGHDPKALEASEQKLTELLQQIAEIEKEPDDDSAY